MSMLGDPEIYICLGTVGEENKTEELRLLSGEDWGDEGLTVSVELG